MGWLILWAVLGAVLYPGSLEMLAVLIFFPVIGLGLGAGQWFSLRHSLSISPWWILATGLGWLLGLSVDFSFQQMVGPTVWLGFALTGLYQATLQWLLLRRGGWAAILWLPVCTFSWMAAGLAYHLLSAPFNRFVGTEWAATVVLMMTWAAAALVFALPSAPVILHLARGKFRGYSGR